MMKPTTTKASVLIQPLTRTICIAVVAIGCIGISTQATAQRLGERLRANKSQDSETDQRRPNNQVEGRIWEYKSIEYKTTLKKGEVEPPPVKGKFRVEGTKVFDATRKLNVKPRDERNLRSILKGQGGEISLPAGPEDKRIGEYRKLSDGRLRFDFNDPKTLNGIMIVWKKPNTNSVWLGDYKKRDGDKTVAEWNMELRMVEN